MSISVAILTDNRARSSRYVCEHGLSVYAEVDDCRVLLDTGQTSKCVTNAEALGIDLSKLDYIILSHGHYDHAGGLAAVLRIAQHAKVVAHPLATRPKYSVSTVMTKPNGFPQPELLHTCNTIWAENIVHLTPNITVFSLPQAAKPNTALRIKDKGLLIPDPFTDELFVLLRSTNQTMLYGGCTHHGLEQLLSFTNQQLGVEQVSLFVGGLHLRGSDTETIKREAELAARHHVERWIINHCSGDEAISLWQQRFGTKPELGYAGSRFSV